MLGTQLILTQLILRLFGGKVKEVGGRQGLNYNFSNRMKEACEQMQMHQHWSWFSDLQIRLESYISIVLHKAIWDQNAAAPAAALVNLSPGCTPCYSNQLCQELHRRKKGDEDGISAPTLSRL